MRAILVFLFAATLSAQLVQIAPYCTPECTPGIGTQALTTNATTDTSMDVLLAGVTNRMQMPFAEPVFQLVVYLGDTSNLLGIEFSQEHPTTYATDNPTVFTATYTAEFTGPFTSNAVNTFVLATPLSMGQQDVIGIHPRWSQPHSANLALLSSQLFPVVSGNGNPTQAETCYYQLNANRPATFTRASMTLIANAGCPIVAMMASPPLFMAPGDSWPSGSFGTVSTQDVWQRVHTNPNLPYISAWAGSYPATPNPTFMYAGWSGQTSAQILARYATDIIAMHPTYVIDEGYINDLAAFSAGCSGAQLAATEANIQGRWTLLQNAGIKFLELLAGPWGSGTTTEMDCKDTLDAWVLANAPAPVVDERCTVGQFRAGGSMGNCWDWQTAYEAMDGLKIHPNQAGNNLIGALIAAKLPYISGNSSSSGGSNAAGSSQ